MIFTSFNFFIFFPIVAMAYWLTPPRYRWGILLVASYFFYINLKPVYALLLLGVTLVTYLFTRLMDQTDSEAKKKNLLTTHIVLVLLPLFFFKYFAAINYGLFTLLDKTGMRLPLPEIQLFLPVGISFYTFMAIGYAIDVYNEEMKAEKNPGLVALFISFFPLILSGPIERAGNMLPQFRQPASFRYDDIKAGVKLMIWGYFMKLVVADRLSMFIDPIFQELSVHSGLTIFSATLFYPFQVYADLGGYTLIAIGTARLMGLKVMHNFRQPFFAISMSDFWRRWHISLISWLRDYLYTPLSFGLRKYGKWGVVAALLLTFLISGIWHGAAFAFVVWGLLQGTFLSIEAVTKKSRESFFKKHGFHNKSWFLALCMLFTYFLFMLSMVFARTESTAETWYVFKQIIFGISELKLTHTNSNAFILLTVISLVVIFIKDTIVEYSLESKKILKPLAANTYAKQFTYATLIVMTLLLGVFNGEGFIYFQY